LSRITHHVLSIVKEHGTANWCQSLAGPTRRKYHKNQNSVFARGKKNFSKNPIKPAFVTKLRKQFWAPAHWSAGFSPLQLSPAKSSQIAKNPIIHQSINLSIRVIRGFDPLTSFSTGDTT